MGVIGVMGNLIIHKNNEVRLSLYILPDANKCPVSPDTYDADDEPSNLPVIRSVCATNQIAIWQPE